MKKVLIALATVATVTAATFAVPTDANAGHRSWHRGAVIGGAILGGALIAGALAPRYRPYAEEEGWAPYDYAGGYPVDCPGGYWARRCLATNSYGDCVRTSKPRFFCPAY
jgi:hypothetical protein